MKFDPRAASMIAKMSKTFCCSAAAAALGAMIVIAPAASGLSAASAESNVVKMVKGGTKQQQIVIGLDKTLVLELPADAHDILVANPEVADAVSRSSRRIYVFGKDLGDTNIFVFGKNGEQIANLNLKVDRDISGLQEHLGKYLEDADIKVEVVNYNVILSGTVQTAADSSKAEALANAFMNGLGSASALARIQARNSAASNGGSNNVIITSSNSSDGGSSIVNLLQILGDDQVALKVTVAEISRVVMKQLGVNMFANGNLGGISFSGNVGPLTGLGSSIADGGQTLSGKLGNTTLSSYLNAMEQSGVMRTLAEPTLTAISGEKAEFRVGGEFNILTNASRSVDDAGARTETESYAKVEYGIGLEFLPIVLGPGRINLKVRTSVSEPTSEAPAQAVGRNIISIRKRLADTTVELPSGGSMMIAGLVRDDVRQVLSGYPGASKIPILGTLFRSRDFVRNETELVIIVTPYLVRPVARNKLNRPDDNFNVASDGAGMFLGKLNKVYGTMKTDRPAGRYHGVVGYIYK
jgi:pilus assembly protein CpaC